MTIKLSIIIVAYGSPSILERCLQSIPKTADWEVIVIDNMVNNIGFAAGCNRGAKQAKGKFLLFLNPDCIVDEKSLLCLVNHLETNPETGIVAPKIVNTEKQPQRSYSLQPTFASAFIVYSFIGSYFPKLPIVKNHWITQGIATKTLRVGTVTGAAFMMPRALFTALHGFDERFFMYWEETDLCRRCLAQGKQIIFEPEAVVMHEGAACTPKNRRLVLRWFKKSRLYFFTKHFGSFRGHIVESYLRLTESWRLVLFTMIIFGLSWQLLNL
jgi:GT2 family glycosyltransferase